jgi:hypothetical protein
MLRKIELRRVLGRRLVERLLRAKWIEPVSANGRIYFAEQDVHLALKRVQREGYLLNGHVRNVSFSARPKVPKRSLEDTLADIDLPDVL